MKIVVLVALGLGAMSVGVFCVRELWSMWGRTYVFPRKKL